MRKYVREIIDDIRRKHGKDYVPPVINLNPAPAPVLPDDIENQALSNNPAERVKQLDFQAQETEEGVPLD